MCNLLYSVIYFSDLKMTTREEISIHNSQKEVRVNFQYFIQSAVKEELPWKTLASFLTDLTTSLDQSKEVIKILVEELQVWVTKAKSEAKIAEIVEKEQNYAKDDSIDIECSAIKIESSNEELDNLGDENDLVEEEIRNSNLDIKAIVKDPSQIENFYEFIGDNENKILPPSTNNFQCKTCSKVFSKRIYLGKHEKTHTGEKSFQCKTCKKSFALPATLKNMKEFIQEKSLFNV